LPLKAIEKREEAFKASSLFAFGRRIENQTSRVLYGPRIPHLNQGDSGRLRAN